jgi:hypothetical protein
MAQPAGGEDETAHLVTLATAEIPDLTGWHEEVGELHYGP